MQPELVAHVLIMVESLSSTKPALVLKGKMGSLL